jgi:hypothetical protein
MWYSRGDLCLKSVVKIQHFGPCFSGLFVDQKWAICYTKNMIKAHPNSLKRTLATLFLVGFCEFLAVFLLLFGIFW